ncbi:hypothetical protein AVEN_9434-1 [Araneus ventricosus]|uniref:Uncharacterized protein n=1 Tax=Araneus ventricosus TaxID=182803 RepID=A0A4Y2FQK6_ARAVE|nr:hypothetical protein AVEN_9434-1 [Araneus ventricosus]
MELILNRPLQWFVCQLHANELPVHHLFVHVDETTTGPRSFNGEIGKSLAGCEKLPVVSFTPIECTVCEVTNKKDLSTDQLYLMEICDPSTVDIAEKVRRREILGKFATQGGLQPRTEFSGSM